MRLSQSSAKTSNPRHFPRFQHDQTPSCPRHGRMKLMDPDVTPFLSQRIPIKNVRCQVRQVYRCLKCPRVAPGPVGAIDTLTHGGHEVNAGWLKYTRPW
jgi:hypothetical protein